MNKSKFATRGLSTLIAVGGSLATLPAAALQLGELSVQSYLGQPLRASIAFALAPNEQISSSCVTLQSGAPASGLPGIGNAAISIANGTILLTGSTAVHEPMISAHVLVNCPYTAHLSREYMLFIDPATPARNEAVATRQLDAQTAPVNARETSIEATTTAKSTPPQRNIGPASRYSVKAGDSLSKIAERLENRSVGLWAAVNAIFEANPDAFMNDDPNQLKAGVWLSIPSFDGNVTVVGSADASLDIATADVDVAASTTKAAVAATESAAELTVTTGDLQPVIAVLGDSPFIQPAASPENTVTVDTRPQAPVSTSTSPNATTAVISTSSPGSAGLATPSWLLWLIGSGIALFGGLLIFGRRLAGKSESESLVPLAAGESGRRMTDTDVNSEQLETREVDYDLGDDSPTEENLALDADVIDGIGLDGSAESNVSEDFGFAATTELDIELPFEPVASVNATSALLSPLHTDELSVLQSKMLPEGEDDYDMSILIDATKMPQSGDTAQHDLNAVPASTGDETSITENYTIDKEIDFEALEQDYEDEFTATQALNKEIARAAEELAHSMDGESADSEKTTALPRASVTELDTTAQIAAQNDDNSDLDATSEVVTINENADDATVEMPKSGKAR